MGDAHEFRKDEWCLVRPLLTNNVFHRRGIHSIPQGSDQRQIRNRQQRIKVVLLDCLVTVKPIAVQSVLPSKSHINITTH
jgi:hypothetical protein